ncbi:hypothetical protein BDV11DRAFT_186102 [Aspergillus similis]
MLAAGSNQFRNIGFQYWLTLVLLSAHAHGATLWYVISSSIVYCPYLALRSAMSCRRGLRAAPLLSPSGTKEPDASTRGS